MHANVKKRREREIGPRSQGILIQSPLWYLVTVRKRNNIGLMSEPVYDTLGPEGSTQPELGNRLLIPYFALCVVLRN